MEKEINDLKKFADEYGFGYINRPLNNLNIEDSIVDLIDAEIAQKYKVLPYEITGDNNEKTLEFLTCNTEIMRYQQDLLELINLKNIDNQFSKLAFFLVEEEHLLEAITQFYNLTFSNDIYNEENYENSLIVVDENEENKDEDFDISEASNDSSPIVALVIQLFVQLFRIKHQISILNHKNLEC